MIRHFVCVLCLVLAAAGCSANRKQISVNTSSSPSTRECYTLVVMISPFKIGRDRPRVVEGAIHLSKEEMDYNGIGSVHNARPWSEQEFKAYVAKQAREYQAESVRFEDHSRDEDRTVTAILEKPKFGLNSREGSRIATIYYTQVIKAGKPCGVWETSPK